MRTQVDERLLGTANDASSNEKASESLETILRRVAGAFADRDRVFLRFREFEALQPDTFSKLSSEPERLRSLGAVFAVSRFLSEECSRHPDWLLALDRLESVLSAAEYTHRLQHFVRVQDGVSALPLSLFRRKELLRIAVRDALQLASVAQVTEELSNLADAILSCALSNVQAEAQTRFGTPMTDVTGQLAPATFSVIALGKLGGRELNYSSDIDLMFVYSGNGETSGPHSITNKEFFKKVANQLTTLLSTYTLAGLCYRIDLRLRPEGSLGDVAISLEGAKEYYAKRARDWELQMLIKARVAAGDDAPGRELLEYVEPSIYSTTLDFSTIETMSATRERISEKLARKRLRKSELDVKLARGGIRDIEFLVQCLQRLHGARDAALRHGGTLFALRRLLEGGLISESEHHRLSGAYEFLRHLEHRLQLEDDRQTHALPADPREMEAVARRMPPSEFNSSARTVTHVQLLQTLNHHLENVQSIYERIVHAQRPLSYTPSVVFAVPPSPAVQVREEAPAVNRPAATLPPALQEKYPNFAQSIQAQPVRSSPAVLERFIEALDRDPYYGHLIEGHSVVASHVTNILATSPFLSEQLIHDVNLLDAVRRIADNPGMRPAFEALTPPLNDIAGLRRFFRREMFRILVGSICLPEPVFSTLDRTSGLAEFVIARAYRVALEQARAHARMHATKTKPFEEPQGQMMVVALGRLGMREFDLGSDADVLFILPDEEMPRHRFWTRVGEHMIEILTAYSSDGTILSLDTRLRPNGREGLLVQSESNYVEYFAHHAEAWEGIAYMKARAVAGDLERATNFLTRLQQVDWRRYGQSGRSRQDLRQMRMRLQREQGALSPLKAGEGGYYDADFILMYLRLKGAGMFFKSLNTPERIDIVEKMGHLERADAEFLMEATTFFRAVDHAIRIVNGRAEERL
ncbi:MAG: hypothetical protein JO061_23375, partial [Acidobacteriaceae bacterium]|nr:hypothetical protein [Acidobacteriaceae bacterium]